MYKYRANYGVYKQLNIFYLNRCPKSPGILGFYDKDVVQIRLRITMWIWELFYENTITYFSNKNLRSWKLINKLKCTLLGGGVLDWLVFI